MSSFLTFPTWNLHSCLNSRFLRMFRCRFIPPRQVLQLGFRLWLHFVSRHLLKGKLHVLRHHSNYLAIAKANKHLFHEICSFYLCTWDMSVQTRHKHELDGNTAPPNRTKILKPHHPERHCRSVFKAWWAMKRTHAFSCLNLLWVIFGEFEFDFVATQFLFLGLLE